MKKGPQRGWGSLLVQGVWPLPKELWGTTYSTVFRNIRFSFWKLQSDCGKEDAGGSEAGLGQDREGNDNGPEY